jgi:hypothetical protein
MIEINDIEQMIYLFTSGIEVNTTTAGDITTFEISMFGVKIVFLGAKAGLTGTGNDDGWRIIYIKPNDLFEEKKMEVIWELMGSGYFSYLRSERPRTFKEMITQQGWDRKVIEKRLELYGDDPKYNYLRDLNQWAAKQSSGYLLSTDPSFFDFLLN